MIITKTNLNAAIEESSFLESNAFKFVYLPIGSVIGIGALILVLISLIHVCAAFSTRPPSPRIRRRNGGAPSPPPAYRQVIRRERLARLATITNLRNLSPQVQPQIPPSYETAVEGEIPPTYAYVNAAFSMPPSYSA